MDHPMEEQQQRHFRLVRQALIERQPPAEGVQQQQEEADNNNNMEQPAGDDDDDHDNVDDPSYEGYWCDECGGICSLSSKEFPIYHSTRIIDYDICQECYEVNHKRWELSGAFLPVAAGDRDNNNINNNNHVDGDLCVQAGWKEDVLVCGWNNLVHLLRNEEKMQYVSLHFDDPEEDDSLVDWRALSDKVEEGISNHPNLKVFNAALPDYTSMPDWEIERQIELSMALVEAFMCNPSLVNVHLEFDFGNTPEEVVDHICSHPIQLTTNIQYITFYHRDDGEGEEEEDDDHLSKDRRIQSTAFQFFYALQDCGTPRVPSSLYSFSCRGMKWNLSCAKAAVKAMKMTPNLQRIKAEFESDIPKKQAQIEQYKVELQQLMDAKKTKWERGWNDVRATNASRLSILQEILNKVNDDQDQVAALFHFIVSNPGSLPEVVGGGDDDDDDNRMVVG